MSTAWIRVIFGVVLGVVLLFSTAFGVAMALPGPKPPEDPGVTFRQLTAGGDNDSSQNRLTASVDKYFDDAQDFRDAYITYQRNTFLAGTGIAVLLAAIGLLLPAAVNYLRWGLLFGALLAMVWVWQVATRAVPNPAPAANSVLALLAAGEPEPLDFAGRFLRFAVSFVSLIVLLFVGLWRLTEWPAPARRHAPAPAPAPVTSAAPPAGWAPPVAPAPAPAAAQAPPSPPAPVADPPPADTMRVVAEPAGADSPPPPAPDAGQWQRPAGSPEPARNPDAPA
jgi:hypothetical protein